MYLRYKISAINSILISIAYFMSVWPIYHIIPATIFGLNICFDIFLTIISIIIKPSGITSRPLSILFCIWFVLYIGYTYYNYQPEISIQLGEIMAAIMFVSSFIMLCITDIQIKKFNQSSS